jgi:hypothetical protein
VSSFAIEEATKGITIPPTRTPNNFTKPYPTKPPEACSTNKNTKQCHKTISYETTRGMPPAIQNPMPPQREAEDGRGAEKPHLAGDDDPAVLGDVMLSDFLEPKDLILAGHGRLLRT